VIGIFDIIIITGTIALNAKQYLSYTEAHFEVFRPAGGGHVAPMG